MNESYIKLVEDFHTLERENNLFDISIKGHPFWEYIRYYVFEEINRTKSHVQFPIKKIYYLKKFSELVQYFMYRLHCFFQKQKRFDILFFTHTRTAQIDGKKVYFHVYPIVQALHKSFKTMIAHQQEFPICKSDYPCPVIKTRSLYLFSRLKSYFVKFSVEDQSTFTNISLLINKIFNTKVDIHLLAKSIYARNLIYYNEFLKFFKTYLPSVIIYCDSGEMKPILKAAHELGITAIDYQHGIISPVSLLYRYPKGFNLEKVKNTNADSIFTFGDYWHNFLRTPSKPVSVGFPYFDLSRQNFVSSSRNEKSILITSVLSSRKILAHLALDLANLMPDYTIYYRRRTEEHDLLESIYPPNFIKKKNIIIVGGKDSSLYDDFAKCKYLVSTNSMTLYEGIASGLKTFVLKAGWYEEVEELYRQKYALLVSSAQEIAEAINNKKDLLYNFQIDENLFKKNSLYNVELYFNSLLRKSYIVK